MHKLEKPCKILLLVNALFSVLGYVGFIQTHYQLVSPLIPQPITYEIAKGPMIASLTASSLLLVSLCFYFFNQRVITIILSSISVVAYLTIPDFVNYWQH